VGAQATQVVERIAAGGRAKLSWSAQATGMPAGNLVVMVKATAAGAKASEVKHAVQVPELTPELRVYPAQQVVPLTTDDQPTLIPIDVLVAPARDFRGAKVSLSYDPSVLEVLYVRRGEAFVEDGKLLAPWSAGHVAEGIITDVGGLRGEAPLLNTAEARVFRVVFIAKGPGATALTLKPTAMFGPGGKEIAHRVVIGKVVVKAMEENR